MEALRRHMHGYEAYIDVHGAQLFILNNELCRCSHCTRIFLEVWWRNTLAFVPHAVCENLKPPSLFYDQSWQMDFSPVCR